MKTLGGGIMILVAALTLVLAILVMNWTTIPFICFAILFLVIGIDLIHPDVPPANEQVASQQTANRKKPQGGSGTAPPREPRRLPGSWDLALPPGCVKHDFTGCAHDALLVMLRDYSGDDLKRAVVEQILRYGATNNQRMLLHLACDWLREGGEAMPDTVTFTLADANDIAEMGKVLEQYLEQALIAREPGTYGSTMRIAFIADGENVEKMFAKFRDHTLTVQLVMARTEFQKQLVRDHANGEPIDGALPRWDGEEDET